MPQVAPSRGGDALPADEATGPMDAALESAPSVSDPLATLLRLGYWAAMVCGIGAAAYGVAAVSIGALAAPAITWESFDRFAAEYRTVPTLIMVAAPFVVAVAFPVLVVAVYATASAERRPLALIAVVFAAVYTAVLGADYWVQATTVPWNLLRGTTEGIAPWVMWNPAGFFWSFEAFGYFAMGVSCAFLAFAHPPGVLPHRLRRGLLAMAVLGMAFMVNSFKDLVLELVRAEGHAGIEGLTTASALLLVFTWVLLFGFVAFSLARWFRWHGRQPQHPHSTRPRARVPSPTAAIPRRRWGRRAGPPSTEAM